MPTGFFHLPRVSLGWLQNATWAWADPVAEDLMSCGRFPQNCWAVAGLILIGALVVLAGRGMGLAQEKPAKSPQVFDRTADVMKLLEMHCVQCHDPKKQRGGWDLSTREHLLKGSDQGPAVVPGHAGKSRLMQLVRHLEKP